MKFYCLGSVNKRHFMFIFSFFFITTSLKIKNLCVMFLHHEFFVMYILIRNEKKTEKPIKPR
jgi:hypothetical protein